MTIQEIHRLVRTKFEQVAAGTLDNFIEEEIDDYINDAVERFINEQMLALRSANSSMQTEQVYESLRSLIETDNINLSEALSPPLSVITTVNVRIGDLPTEYRAFISARSVTENNFTNVNKVTQREFFEYLPTETDIPLFKDNILVINNDDVWVAYETGGSEVTDLLLTYLREPTRANYNTDTTVDLPPSEHTKIVSMVVNLMRRDLYIPQPTEEEEEDDG